MKTGKSILHDFLVFCPVPFQEEVFSEKPGPAKHRNEEELLLDEALRAPKDVVVISELPRAWSVDFVRVVHQEELVAFAKRLVDFRRGCDEQACVRPPFHEIGNLCTKT